MKARKQGNALTLTIPAKFNIPEGTEYMAMKKDDGTLVFVPKEPNIFTDPRYQDVDLRTPDLFDFDSAGREI